MCACVCSVAAKTVLVGQMLYRASKFPSHLEKFSLWLNGNLELQSSEKDERMVFDTHPLSLLTRVRPRQRGAGGLQVHSSSLVFFSQPHPSGYGPGEWNRLCCVVLLSSVCPHLHACTHVYTRVHVIPPYHCPYLWKEKYLNSKLPLNRGWELSASISLCFPQPWAFTIAAVSLGEGKENRPLFLGRGGSLSRTLCCPNYSARIKAPAGELTAGLITFAALFFVRVWLVKGAWLA